VEQRGSFFENGDERIMQSLTWRILETTSSATVSLMLRYYIKNRDISCCVCVFYVSSRRINSYFSYWILKWRIIFD